ncbi:hypothetical protein [Umezawaea tangerina]|uniref:Uncharacterized protein n=1 Tax=Umezawaea tangerina TaxID=84725 RepID=A0A2T0TK10_9PSEU|nr:hypothetical protein [Umezawaea tangerina]PRY46003.1 hypothetical protein CLV43_101267 [Umezawaea tangerina]
MSTAFTASRGTWWLPASARVLVDRTSWAAPTTTRAPDSRTGATGGHEAGVGAAVPARRATDAGSSRTRRLHGFPSAVGGAV